MKDHSANNSTISIEDIFKNLFVEDHVLKSGDYECTVKIENNNQWVWSGNMSILRSKSIALGVDRSITTQRLSISPSLIRDFFERYKYFNRNRNLAKSLSSIDTNDFSLSLNEFIEKRQKNIRKQNEIDWQVDHVAPQSIKIDEIESIISNKYNHARLIFSEMVQSALLETISSSLENEDGVKALNTQEKIKILNNVLKNKDKILDILSGIDNFLTQTIISKLENFGENEILLDDFNSILVNLLKNINEKISYETTLLEAVNLLVEKFNFYLNKKKELVIDKSGILIKINNESHGLDNLSSGERHILTFLCLVLFQARDRDFLIIDEPEISLNNLWQRGLIDLFESLAPNTQIIVASHSPAIVSNRRDRLAKLITAQTPSNKKNQNG